MLIKPLADNPEPASQKKQLERIPVAVDKLREQAERFKEIKLRPRVGIIADGDKIENRAW